jgi:hypothetical protein
MTHEPLPVNAVDRSELEVVRVEMASGFARMEGRLDAYVQGHANQHATEQQAFGSHLVDAAVRASKSEALEKLPERVDALEDWRIEVRTLGTLLRLTFGTSLITAIAGGIALGKSLGLI